MGTTAAIMATRAWLPIAILVLFSLAQAAFGSCCCSLCTTGCTELECTIGGGFFAQNCYDISRCANCVPKEMRSTNILVFKGSNSAPKPLVIKHYSNIVASAPAEVQYTAEHPVIPLPDNGKSED